MGPRDPIERELLRQLGDPLVLREDPGWIKLAGARAMPTSRPLNPEIARQWLASEAALHEADAWIRARTELRQRVDSALPCWRDQVRWVIEFALLIVPGDPHRRAYLSEFALTRAVEAHEQREAAEARARKAHGDPPFVTGTIHWRWVLDWVSEHLPFPDSPPNVPGLRQPEGSLGFAPRSTQVPPFLGDPNE